MTDSSKRIRYAAISCHDFISDAGGGDEFRKFNELRQRLEELGFDLTPRMDSLRPWLPYNLYGRNRAIGGG
jgi:hypothetical protein